MMSFAYIFLTHKFGGAFLKKNTDNVIGTKKLDSALLGSQDVFLVCHLMPCYGTLKGLTYTDLYVP